LPVKPARADSDGIGPNLIVFESLFADLDRDIVSPVTALKQAPKDPLIR
jgi:hypothetical protein